MIEYEDSCEAAHLVPLQESDWFYKNEMSQYTSGGNDEQRAINDLSNILLLRSDVHRAFDRKNFVFVPKYHGELYVNVVGDSE